MKMSLVIRFALLALLLVAVCAGMGFAPNVFSQEKAEAAASVSAEGTGPTVISAELGGCSALITVTGADSKPVYNAKVSTRIRYGMMAAKKLELEVFTSPGGQVKITGLPEAPKRPVFFTVSKGDWTETLEFRPSEHCRAAFDVQMK